ncbi:MAG: hypothetical protein AAGE65_04335 [Planctomycetota bacterium]
MSHTPPFSLDRDLLRACPTLLTDGAAAAHLKLDEPAASINNGRLTASSSLEAKGVRVGSLLTVDGRPYEVTENVNATQIFIAEPAFDPDAPRILPQNGNNRNAVFLDFAAYRIAAYQDVRLRIGLDPEAQDADTRLAAVTNPSLLKQLEIFRALELVFARFDVGREAALNPYWAGFYGGRYAELLSGATLRFDFNGDAFAEQERRFDVLPVTRR